MSMMKPRICVDFDGTIFTGEGIFPGCVEAMTELRKRYSVAIFSARPTDAERKQMVEILNANNVPYDEILPPKPEAVAFIDDKGLHFTDWKDIKTCGY